MTPDQLFSIAGALASLGWLLLVVVPKRPLSVHVASLFYLTPPTTALIAWALFGETLHGLALAGMALAVTGVWLVRR